MRILCLVLLLVGCSQKHLDIKIEGFQTHRDNYKELMQLGVILEPELGNDFREDMMDELRACSTFKGVKLLKTDVELSGDKSKDVKSKFEAMVKKDATARAQNGILALDLINKKVSTSMEKSTAFSYRDKKSLIWSKNFGVPSRNEFGFAQKFEIAPERRISRKPIFIRNATFDFKIKYALYNRVTDKVVIEGAEEVKSSFSNYSRKPALTKSDVQDAIFKGVQTRIIAKICGQKKPLMEQVYLARGETAADNVANEGFELAKQGRWKLAADKWEDAISKNKAHVIAHHNLGVYFEYLGEPQKSLYHYKKVSGSGKRHILKPRLDRYLATYQIPDFSKPMLPQIAFITGGHWVYVHAGKQKLKVGKSYSIYRIEMTRTETDQIVTGTHIREVGKLRLLRKDGEFYQGRTRQTVVDYPILPGDFLVI